MQGEQGATAPACMRQAWRLSHTLERVTPAALNLGLRCYSGRLRGVAHWPTEQRCRCTGIGWNMNYPFNSGDLLCCGQCTANYLDNAVKVTPSLSHQSMPFWRLALMRV